MNEDLWIGAAFSCQAIQLYKLKSLCGDQFEFCPSLVCPRKKDPSSVKESQRKGNKHLFVWSVVIIEMIGHQSLWELNKDSYRMSAWKSLKSMCGRWLWVDSIHIHYNFFKKLSSTLHYFQENYKENLFPLNYLMQ